MKQITYFSFFGYFLLLNGALFGAASSSADASRVEKASTLIPTLAMLAAKAVGKSFCLELNQNGTVAPATIERLNNQVDTILGLNKPELLQAIMLTQLDIVPHKMGNYPNIESGQLLITLSNGTPFEKITMHRNNTLETLAGPYTSNGHYYAVRRGLPYGNQVILVGSNGLDHKFLCESTTIDRDGKVIAGYQGKEMICISLNPPHSLREHKIITTTPITRCQIAHDSSSIVFGAKERKIFIYWPEHESAFDIQIPATYASQIDTIEINTANQLALINDTIIVDLGTGTLFEKNHFDKKLFGFIKRANVCALWKSDGPVLDLPYDGSLVQSAAVYQNALKFILIKNALDTENIVYADAIDGDLQVRSLVGAGSNHLKKQSDLSVLDDYLDSHLNPLMRDHTRTAFANVLHQASTEYRSGNHHETRPLYALMAQGNTVSFYNNYGTDEAFKYCYSDSSPISLPHIRRMDFNRCATYVENMLFKPEATEDDLGKGIMLLHVLTEAHGENEAYLDRLQDMVERFKHTKQYQAYRAWASKVYNTWQLFNAQYRVLVPASHIENCILRKKAIINSKRSGQGPLLRLLDEAVITCGPTAKLLEQIQNELLKSDGSYALQDIALCLANRTCDNQRHSCLSMTPPRFFNKTDYPREVEICRTNNCVHVLVKDILTAKRQAMTAEELRNLSDIDIVLLTTVVAHLPDPDNPADHVFITHEQEVYERIRARIRASSHAASSSASSSTSSSSSVVEAQSILTIHAPSLTNSLSSSPYFTAFAGGAAIGATSVALALAYDWLRHHANSN